MLGKRKKWDESSVVDEIGKPTALDSRAEERTRFFLPQDRTLVVMVRSNKQGLRWQRFSRAKRAEAAYAFLTKNDS